MQGVLYFPFIRVPASAWATKALLYWDRIGIIVPQRWRWEPELLGAPTLGLVREELVEQFFPEEADPAMSLLYERWIESLRPSELETRRDGFRRRDVVPIHEDKWIRMMSGLEATQALGLAMPSSQPGSWIDVERRTALEFMAALTLSLCHPRSVWVPGEPAAWVPATDHAEAMGCMVSGLVPAQRAPEIQRDIQLRVHGEFRAVDLRALLIDRVLPVPSDPLPVEEIVRFRRRHGGKLPAFRREVESRIDGLLAIEDEVLRQRAVDRLVDEMTEAIDTVEAYLQESGFGRVVRSPLVTMLKVVPGVPEVIGAAVQAAGGSSDGDRVLAEPFAYLAFAKAELRLAGRLKAERGAPSLAEIFDRDRIAGS